ncbi:hypothetical protein [Pusillimonas noertemannii]|uniref:hypothetical protein n=1 Tax=Pusillimonas noertemannii TaxID=305977 RepID=UPI0015D06422|nr:hypothetical protein [Pusillimonas noertemannii]
MKTFAGEPKVGRIPSDQLDVSSHALLVVPSHVAAVMGTAQEVECRAIASNEY